MSAPKLIEWSRDGRRASLACRYATRYPVVICGSFVLSLYSCTGWIKLCMTLDSTWCNMYCTGDLLRLLIHGLASIFGSGRFKVRYYCTYYVVIGERSLNYPYKIVDFFSRGSWLCAWRWMTVWVTFNTIFVIYSSWLMDLCILICNSLPVRVRWDLLSTFVLNPCWLFFSEDPDFVPEDFE